MPPVARFLAASLLVLAPAAAAKSPLDAGEILRRAEEVRSPDLDYAVDFSISVLDDYTPGKERSAAYTMVARGKERVLVLMLAPDSFYGGTLLIRAREYWLLLPKASRAIQLSSETVLRGDVSNGDLARANLVADYAARLDGEEAIDGESCHRLELEARSADAAYPRIRGLVTRGKYLPRKYEFYGRTGALLRTACYGDYRKTPLGLRSMKLVVESPQDMHRTTTMAFTNLRRVNSSTLDYSPTGMIAFRDAALEKLRVAGVQARIEDLLEATSSAPRQR